MNELIQSSCHSWHWLNPQRGEKDGSVLLPFCVLLLLHKLGAAFSHVPPKPPHHLRPSSLCCLQESSCRILYRENLTDHGGENLTDHGGWCVMV